jgi:hypothetical protein
MASPRPTRYALRRQEFSPCRGSGSASLCAFQTQLRWRPIGHQLTLRLRRISDGVFIHQETLTCPVGRWFEYQTAFIEIPDSEDQEYVVDLTLSGDAEDELYLSDLYCEIARIRYFIRLDGVGATLFEVTDLRYVDGYAQVVTSTPVNEMSVQAANPEP